MSSPAFPIAQLSPAVARNRDPILAVLRRHLPAQGTVLEIAAGTGEHAAYLAPQFPHLVWQPTDVDPDALASIEAHRAAAGAPNLRAPIALDVTAPAWPVTRADAVLSINMIHISPWAAAQGLMAGAARLLHPAACSISTARSRRTASTRRRAMRRSTQACAPATRNGACATLGEVRALADRHGFDFVERVAHAGEQSEPGVPAALIARLAMQPVRLSKSAARISSQPSGQHSLAEAENTVRLPHATHSHAARASPALQASNTP